MTKFYLPSKRFIEFGIFIFFAVLTLIVRFQSFSIRIMDWDESLYYMWAKDLFIGQLPYVNIIENKPIGISFIYAAAMLIFGKTMLSARILAWLSVTCSSYLLYKIGRILSPNSMLAGMLAGIFYSIYSFFNMGIAANTEVFFLLFTIFAFYLLFNNQQLLQEANPKMYHIFFGIGLSLGFGFLIKYVVAFDILSLFIITLILAYMSPQKNNAIKPKYIIKLLTFLAFGLLLPQCFVMGIYAIKGQLHTFINANVFIFQYASSIPFSFKTMLKDFVINTHLYRILLSTLILFIFFKQFLKEVKLNLICILVWSSIISFELLFYLVHAWSHYYIQLLPPLCLLSSLLVAESLNLIKYNMGFSLIISKHVKPLDVDIKLKDILLCIFLISMICIYYLQLTNHVDNFYNTFCQEHLKNKGTFQTTGKTVEPFFNDRQYQTANYIKKQIGEGQYIFVLSEDYILYDMTDSKHPSQYVMPYMLVDQSLNTVIDKNKEIEKILDKHPEYIVLPNIKGSTESKKTARTIAMNTRISNLLFKRIQKDYILEATIKDNLLYRHK